MAKMKDLVLDDYVEDDFDYEIKLDYDKHNIISPSFEEFNNNIDMVPFHNSDRHNFGRVFNICFCGNLICRNAYRCSYR